MDVYSELLVVNDHKATYPYVKDLKHFPMFEIFQIKEQIHNIYMQTKVFHLLKFYYNYFYLESTTLLVFIFLKH